MTTPAEDARREAEIRDRKTTLNGQTAIDFLLRLLAAERANSEGLRKALEDHHNWQLTQGTVWLEDFDGKPTISINGPAEYSDSDMCERTIAALSASPSPSLQPASD